MWRRAMDYLGLGADENYDDYDQSMEIDRPQRNVRSGYGADPSGRMPRQRMEPEHDDHSGAIPQDTGGYRRGIDDSGLQLRPVGSPRQSTTVRPLTVSGAEPATVKPLRFEQAKEIADRFKEGQPVIMNLESCDKEVVRRLIDFGSGLCYAMNGSMERVATDVFLLKPPASRSQYE
jgi:cell division inhibitor SepF